MEFNFVKKSGIGLHRLLTNVTPECADVITKLLAYFPDDRYSAKQALNHPYFSDLLKQDISIQAKQSLMNFK